MPKTREYTKNNMKMIFASGNQTFDRYVVSVTPGQSIGGGVTALCIRAHSDLRDPWDKLTRRPGQNQDYDLGQFKEVPIYFKRRVAEHTKDAGATLHEFYHYKDGRKVIHGWLLMRNGVLVDRCDGHRLRAKSCMVLDEALKYLSNDYDDAGNLIVA